MTSVTESKEVAELEAQIADLRKQLAAARRAVAAHPVDDYVLQSGRSAVRLSELFGDRSELLVVHNMGRSCPYCTLWADGFAGVAPHLESRCAFVIASPDEPAEQAKFAADRGWPFRMVSYGDGTFAEDMGVHPSADVWWPAVSAFHRADDGTITRTGFAVFGPGDDFCSVWHFFDLLEHGRSNWTPKYVY